MKAACLTITAILLAATADAQEGTRWRTWAPFSVAGGCELKLVDVFQRAPDQPIYFKIKNISKNRVSYHFGMTVLRGTHAVVNPTISAENVSPGETRDSQTPPIKGSLSGTAIQPRVESCVLSRSR